MKKFISTILIMTFMFSTLMVATTALADSRNNRGKGFVPPGLAKKEYNLPRGIAKKIFDDIDGIQWAKEAIELMQLKGLIRGYGEGRFAPNNAVTKLETVIMALRVMGWESEVEYIRQLPNNYRGKQVGDWAKGYITIAYEKGILDDIDMMYFNPNASAQRFEVAKYVIRALGYEKDAQKSMKERLPFVDAELVPQGVVGYVYLVNDLKLMQGDDNRAFNPMGTLTRAEMAVLFHRLDQKVDRVIGENEYQGVISQISDYEITLNINSRSRSFEVAYDVVVYDSKGRSDYSNLSRGVEVIIMVMDGEVVSIRVVEESNDRDKIISRFSGEVIDLYNNRESKEITVQVESMKVTFVPVDNVKIYFQKELGNFEDINLGDAVTIIVDTKNRAREIHVDRRRVVEVSEIVKGYITAIDLGRRYRLEIDGETYPLSGEAAINIEDIRNADFLDLEIGHYVECELVDNIIEVVNAEDRFDVIRGVVQSVNRNSIEVAIGRRIREYEYADTLKISIDGEDGDLKDIKEGMTVDLKVLDTVVYLICR